MSKADVGSKIQRGRRRGFYSETASVRKLEKDEYNAVGVPVSNPSRNPLPDIIARRNKDVYPFEVKTADFYAYFPKKQADKLFEFLEQFIPIANRYKRAVLIARFGKRWIFHELDWRDWRRNMLPEKMRITKRDRGNFDLKRDRRR